MAAMQNGTCTHVSYCYDWYCCQLAQVTGLQGSRASCINFTCTSTYTYTYQPFLSEDLRFMLLEHFVSTPWHFENTFASMITLHMVSTTKQLHFLWVYCPNWRESALLIMMVSCMPTGRTTVLVDSRSGPSSGRAQGKRRDRAWRRKELCHGEHWVRSSKGPCEIRRPSCVHVQCGKAVRRDSCSDSELNGIVVQIHTSITWVAAIYIGIAMPVITHCRNLYIFSFQRSILSLHKENGVFTLFLSHPWQYLEAMRTGYKGTLKQTVSARV